jgi:hypothetical protein
MIAPSTQRSSASQVGPDRNASRMNATSHVSSPIAISMRTTLFFWLVNSPFQSNILFQAFHNEFCSKRNRSLHPVNPRKRINRINRSVDAWEFFHSRPSLSNRPRELVAGFSLGTRANQKSLNEDTATLNRWEFLRTSRPNSSSPASPQACGRQVLWHLHSKLFE